MSSFQPPEMYERDHIARVFLEVHSSPRVMDCTYMQAKGLPS